MTSIDASSKASLQLATSAAIRQALDAGQLNAVEAIRATAVLEARRDHALPYCAR